MAVVVEAETGGESMIWQSLSSLSRASERFREREDRAGSFLFLFLGNLAGRSLRVRERRSLGVRARDSLPKRPEEAEVILDEEELELLADDCEHDLLEVRSKDSRGSIFWNL